MREIKFRAWDKERKEMLPVGMLDFSQWWVDCGLNGERNSFKNEETDRHILMQYTGLKDVEGVEIYESDILLIEISNYSTGKIIASQKAVVEYRECKYGVEFGRTFTGLDGFSNTTFKVVGNIFERAAILEVTS